MIRQKGQARQMTRERKIGNSREEMVMNKILDLY